ncbi:RagB/SusD family nutrient uptake outer membrane protein [Mucilaginibacter sp. X4EP1]|uniref:RagB/SusD family nutrient uptake outer membrane protein n=1 Tax=Mucilaginibacter sp. X4EP1 TaxID=2723092 RepID=UPI002169CE4C|nr:RagB/SusD family nutrient uptake outer membrane protein [Mucilaginibacter sp. X4EP1]MCS3812837.1 hypothetical protein [Mucilaginibacter sp. X4EP1]
MKTIKILLFAPLALLLFGGCKKILQEDPKATLTPGTYYKTQSDLDGAVNAMYIVLARDGSWGFTSKMFSYFGSDDLTTDPGLNKADQRDFDRLSGGSTNQSLPAEWNGPWACIYQANNVISVYKNVNSTDALKNESAGQAYFLRGLCYYYLVRTFGEVPLVLGTIDPNSRPPRASVSDVYASIISDLNTAKSMLGTTLEQGKPNVYAVSSVLSDVYQTMAGWPLNQTSNYALAAAAANTVIQAGVYDLNTPYDKVFSTNNSSESIFALQYNVAASLPQRSFGSTSVPLDEVALDGSSGWDDFYPELTFFKDAPKCTRTDLTFYTTLKIRNTDNVTFTLYPWYDSHTHAQHPYYKKFRAGLNGDGVNETATTINSIQPSTNKAYDIMRYPQVLLNYAESSDMAGGGPTAQSYAAINQVRARAGEPPLTPGLSQQAFRDSVVYERAYECAGEFGVRWFDICRLQLLPTIIAVRDPSENPIPAGTNVQEKYLAPIPYAEMVLNPAWKQNPGY